MKAIKGNRVYTITEADVKAFVNEGFDIIGDDGKVKAYGKGKTVSYEVYVKLKKQVVELQDQIDKLEGEIKDLKKKKASTKKNKED